MVEVSSSINVCFYDARRNADSNAALGDVLCDDGIGTDHRSIANRDWAEYLGACAYVDIFAHTGNPTSARVSANSDTLINLCTITNNGVVVYNDPQATISDYDPAPEDELNRILWGAAKGPGVPYPTPIHRVLFTGSPVSGTEN